MHPVTWYKVQFDDGSVAAFRPSALAYVQPRAVQSTDSIRHISADSRASCTSTSTRTSSARATLCQIAPDAWVGLRVRIRAGKYIHELARVSSSGNGWLQLQLLENSDEVAKRASDLEIVDESAHSNFESPESVSQRLQVRGPESTQKSSDWVLPVTMSNDSLTALVRSSSRIPLVSHHLRDARRMSVLRYIERGEERLRRRPNLTYWKHQVVASMVEPTVEVANARKFIDNVCSTCNFELWPTCNFCWNEGCLKSPIYWKLPGASGFPPLTTSIHDSGTTTLRIYEEPNFSPVTSFLLSVPCRVVGDSPQKENDIAFPSKDRNVKFVGHCSNSDSADSTDLEHRPPKKARSMWAH